MSQASNKGFTIFELILAMSISIIMIAMIVSIYSISLRLFSQVLSRSDVFWNGQLAMNRMTTEIRESLMVTDPGAGNISFWWKDFNLNGTSESGEIVTYSLSGNNLIRSSGGASQNIAGGVSFLGFDYNITPRPRLVTITLRLNSANEAATIESKAKVRNEP